MQYLTSACLCLDGYTLAHELRLRLGHAAPVLIAVTGFGRDQDKRRSDEAGFTLHLLKPVTAEKLLEALDTLASATASPT